MLFFLVSKRRAPNIIITQESREERRQSVKLDYTAESATKKEKGWEERNDYVSVGEKNFSHHDCANQGDLNHCSRASLAENVAARCSKNSKPLSAK